jgi:hypothetical protein
LGHKGFFLAALVVFPGRQTGRLTGAAGSKSLNKDKLRTSFKDISPVTILFLSHYGVRGCQGRVGVTEKGQGNKLLKLEYKDSSPVTVLLMSKLRIRDSKRRVGGGGQGPRGAAMRRGNRR